MIDSAPDNTVINVAAQVDGFEAPLPELVAEPNQPTIPNSVFRANRVLPMKLRLFCGTQLLSDADVAPPSIVGLTKVGDAPAGLTVVNVNSTASNDDGPLFRFSSDGNWIYNLGTKTLSPDSVYKIVIQMPDGLRYAAHIALK